MHTVYVLLNLPTHKWEINSTTIFFTCQAKIGSAIWDPSTHKDINNIECVQKHANSFRSPTLVEPYCCTMHVITHLSHWLLYIESIDYR